MGALPPDLRETDSVGAQTREWLVAGAGVPALAEGRIELCGVSLARPGFSFVRHAWEHSQLLMSLGPGGACWHDGGWHDLPADAGYLTPAGITHAYRCRPGRAWLLAWVILREPEDAPRLVTADLPAIVTGDARPLHDAILNLHRETLGTADPAMLRLWGDVVVALVRRQLAPARADQRLWRLWEEVDADLGRPWTLGDLARRIGLGDEQLRRLCLRHLGVSPRLHLTALRMRRAAALIATSSRPVGEIAGLVGYDNAFAFSTAFRRHHGVPPSRLRLTPAVVPDARSGDAARRRRRP